MYKYIIIRCILQKLYDDIDVFTRARGPQIFVSTFCQPMGGMHVGPHDCRNQTLQVL